MRKSIAAAFAALLALPALASAHVTVQPNTAPAGGFTRLNVRVPNEQDNASTVKVEVQMPPGFGEAAYEAVPGWTVKVTKRKAQKPIEVEGLKMTEEVDTVTFAADKGAGIGAGQFQDFGLSVGIPAGKAGDKLTFKAIQTYSNGDVVRWIGDPSADEPAPQVTLTAAGGETTAAATPAAGSSSPTDTSAAGESEDGNGLAIVALIVGALGLAVGGAGFATARKARTS